VGAFPATPVRSVDLVSAGAGDKPAWLDMRLLEFYFHEQYSCPQMLEEGFCKAVNAMPGSPAAVRLQGFLQDVPQVSEESADVTPAPPTAATRWVQRAHRVSCLKTKSSLSHRLPCRAAAAPILNSSALLRALETTLRDGERVLWVRLPQIERLRPVSLFGLGNPQCALRPQPAVL
jgi:hypothetical protein